MYCFTTYFRVCSYEFITEKTRAGACVRTSCPGGIRRDGRSYIRVRSQWARGLESVLRSVITSVRNSIRPPAKYFKTRYCFPVIFPCQNRSHIYNSRVSPANYSGAHRQIRRRPRNTRVYKPLHANHVCEKNEENPSWKPLPIELRETMRGV